MLSIPYNVWYGAFAKPVMEYLVDDDDACTREIESHVVYDMYIEPSRVYHNAYHPYWMYTFAWENGIKLTLAQHIAILFHDVIYEVGALKGSNEYNSAEFIINRYNHTDVVDTASAIIRDTATHFDAKPKFHSDESALVLDLDIINMSLPWEQFTKWNAAVEMEYKGANPLGRLEFLRSFVAKDVILHSDELKHREGLIRKNLNRLIDIKEDEVLGLTDEEYSHYNDNY